LQLLSASPYSTLRCVCPGTECEWLLGSLPMPQPSNHDPADQVSEPWEEHPVPAMAGNDVVPRACAGPVFSFTQTGFPPHFAPSQPCSTYSCSRYLCYPLLLLPAPVSNDTFLVLVSRPSIREARLSRCSRSIMPSSDLPCRALTAHRERWRRLSECPIQRSCDPGRCTAVAT
jgi:hypothetical protein